MTVLWPDPEAVCVMSHEKENILLRNVALKTLKVVDLISDPIHSVYYSI